MKLFLIAVLVFSFTDLRIKSGHLFDHPRDIMAGEKLTAGQYIQSENGRFKLIYQADGNLVLTRQAKVPGNAPLRLPETVFWESHTGGTKPGYFTVQNDGNIVIYSNGKAIWQTQTVQPNKSNKYFLRMGDEGSFILFVGADYTRLWTSMTQDDNPMQDHLDEGQTLKLGEALYSSNRCYHVVNQKDGNFCLYRKDGTPVWSSSSNGNATSDLTMKDGRLNLMSANKKNVVWFAPTSFKCCGVVRLMMQNDGNMVLIDKAGKIQWASATPNGEMSHFIGHGYGGCGC